jgi:hypothetical protein
MVARERAAEAAVKNWHTVESYMQMWGMTKVESKHHLLMFESDVRQPVESANGPKPLRERKRTREGAPKKVETRLHN